MGEVVKLKPTPKVRSASATRARTRKSARGRRNGRKERREKTALVLGGGGFTGGVYEIGALRALDLLSANRTVNQHDVYVGTSAGAFVAALCANGVTPDEMMRVVTRQSGQPFREIDLGDLLRLNVGGLARTGVQLPLRLGGLARKLLSQLGQVSLIDVVVGLSEALPSGAYTGAGIERYLARVLSEDGRTDDFRALEHELYLAATDLDTCERIVFGADGYDNVPISRAVRASGALPMVYAPVKIGDRELVDGGIVSTTNLDIAVEAGAKLVIVINPVVPYVNLPDEGKAVAAGDGSIEGAASGQAAAGDGRNGAAAGGERRRRISEMGFPKVGYQAFKLLAHRRLHQVAGMWEERYPGVDIVLIEPEPTDQLMFETSIMSFASRIEIARHGFQSVAHHLLEQYDRYSEIWARHGIEISGRRIRRVVSHFEADEEQVRAWRKILESTTGALLRQSGLG